MSDELTIKFPPPAVVESSLIGESSKQPRAGGAPYAYIYCLSDPRTGEVRYVGKTFDLEHRRRGHLKDSGKNHKVNWIQSLVKAGCPPSMEVLEEIYGADDCAWEDAERFWIATLKFYGVRLLNQDSGGMGGRRLCQEVKAKISRAKMGKTSEAIKRINVGRKRTEEAKASMRKGWVLRRTDVDGMERMKSYLYRVSFVGRKHSDESRRKMSLVKQGNPVSVVTRIKLSVKMNGRKFTPESLAKMSASQKGKTIPQDVRAKISLALKGRATNPWTVESREKLRATVTRWHQLRKQNRQQTNQVNNQII